MVAVVVWDLVPWIRLNTAQSKAMAVHETTQQQLPNQEVGHLKLSNTGIEPAPKWGWAVILALGAVGACVFSAWIPLLDRNGDGFVFKAIDDGRVVAQLPMAWFVAVLGATLVGGTAALISVFKDDRVRLGASWGWGWAKTHVGLSLLVMLCIAGGAIDFYELFYDAYNKKSGLRIWALREDVQVWMGLAAAVMGAMAVSALRTGNQAGRRVALRLRWSLRRECLRWWLLAGLTPLVLGVVMARLALEGIPHFSDSLTYLMQGRILMSGRLWLDSPVVPDLFQHALFFIETQGRFFGKYPIGWPLILGLFDQIEAGYAANAVLASVATVLTGLIGREVASRRVGILAAMVFGLSPWVWFNGANFASHVSSTCAVMGFMWLFLRLLKGDGGWADAVGAGLCLGAGVLIRPFDAAMFALPAIFVVLGMQVRQPRRWIGLGSCIAAGALVGVGVYLWVNANTTGGALKSPYAMESRWESDWNPTAGSALGRFIFQWAEFNGRFPGWGIGGITTSLLGLIAILGCGGWAKTQRGVRRWGLALLAISTGLFFIGCCVFGFTNVWWGPRWLLPVTPLAAIVIGSWLDHLLGEAGRSSRETRTGTATPSQARQAAAQWMVGLMLVGPLIGLGGRYGGQFYQNLISPPHKVSAAVYRDVSRLGLKQVVVGMPINEARPPLDPRAGLVFMTVPFEENAVIFARAIPGWRQAAKASYPGRELYEVIADVHRENGFVVKRLRDGQEMEIESDNGR